jgi:hypothetical protein
MGSGILVDGSSYLLGSCSFKDTTSGILVDWEEFAMKKTQKVMSFATRIQ